MEHNFVKHEDCTVADCIICVKKIDYCRICGGVGGTLTAECCGRPLPEYKEVLISEGKLDFFDGKWIKFDK